MNEKKRWQLAFAPEELAKWLYEREEDACQQELQAIYPGGQWPKCDWISLKPIVRRARTHACTLLLANIKALIEAQQEPTVTQDDLDE